MDLATSGTYADHRYWLTDAPNWEKSARLAMEINMDSDTGRDFTSTVFWYRAPGGADVFDPLTREDLLLPMRHESGSTEAEDLVKTADFERGDLMVVEDPDGRYGVGNNKYVAYAPMGFGDSMTFRLSVKTAGPYEVNARVVSGPSGGFWNFTANQAPLDPKLAATYHHRWHHEETQSSGWINLGRHDLVAGENNLTFTSCSPWTGLQLRGMLLTVDAFRLKPVE
jgi:hypothetical protein